MATTDCSRSTSPVAVSADHVSWLFEQAGQAPSEAQQTRTAVVDVLERLPKPIDDARFLRQLAR